jgi:hypothetical protein
MSPQPNLEMAYGNWVSGAKFWGREKDLELFLQRIDEAANQILSAQRRMGKTSLMREAARRLGDRYTSIFIDLEKCRTPADAIVELSVAARPHQSLWGSVKGLFSNVLSSLTDNVDQVNVGELTIQLRAGLNAGNWSAKGDELFRVLARSSVPVLLLVDEFPILVNKLLKGSDSRITGETRQAASDFLTWLRKNSQEHQGKVRIVLSGSIGLGPVLRQGRLSGDINNFDEFQLHPWSHGAAIGCIRALAQNYKLSFSEGVPDLMIEKLGICIPHHVQMYFRHIHDRCKRQEAETVTDKLAESVYAEEMLSVRGHAELAHYEERLQMVLGEHLQHLAMELLTEAAVAKKLTATAMQDIEARFLGSLSDAAKDLVRGQANFQNKTPASVVREVLEHDGYLKRSGDELVFVSLLLRDWWQARHSFGYVPVAKRDQGGR